MFAKISSSRIAGLLAVFLVLVVLAAPGIAIWVARAQAIVEWRAQLDNLSLLLAEQTSQQVHSAFLVLDSMVDSVQANDVGSAAELRLKMGTLAQFNRMRDTIHGVQQADVATIVDADGDVINFTRAHPAPAINLADRDYFHEHLKQPRLGVYFSKPVRNKGNGQWTFYMSRRLNGAHGEFIGLALVGLSSTFLSQSYQKINLGGDASVTLYRRDFTLLARWPHADLLMGQVDVSGASYQVIEQMQQRHAVVQSSAPHSLQAGGEAARLGAVRLIDDYPLIVNVTVGDALYLAQWRRFSIVLLLVAGFSALAVAAAFMVLIRLLERRERSMEQTRMLQNAAEAANRAKAHVPEGCNIVDTSIPLPHNLHAPLLPPFLQADITVARRYGGAGPGRHLVSQLAANMAGKVSVSSELGLGARFEVAVDAAPADPFGMRLHGHVLLAGDRRDDRLLIGAFLDGIGPGVEVAEDGVRAVELAPAGIEQLAGIEQMAGYAALRAEFSGALAARLAQLAAHIGAQAWSEAEALAHQLKGSAASFGFPGVTLGAGAIEMAAMRADAPAARAAFARLLALDELIPLALGASRDDTVNPFTPGVPS